MSLINCPECNKEMSDQAANCPNCGFQLQKFLIKQRQQKQIELSHQQTLTGKVNLKLIIGIGVAFIIVFIFLAIVFKVSSNNDKLFAKNQDSISVDKTKTDSINIKDQLNREIESTKTFNGSKFRNEVTSIQLEVVVFSVWAKLIKDAASNEDKEIQKLGKSLKSKVSVVQQKEFPIIRSAYAKLLKDKLWPENIEVTIKGNGNTTLEFVGGIFANNKNKQDFQNTLDAILNQLRFKKINYKWYKQDDEYTYYTLKSPNDSEVIEIN